MSSAQKTVCDHCGADTAENTPHLRNGETPLGTRVRVEYNFNVKTLDACSTACLEVVLREFADKISEEAT